MNKRQTIALVIGIAIACLMLAFPPYWDYSGRFGGDELQFFRNPPADVFCSYDMSSLLSELILAALVTATALVALRKTAGRGEKISAAIGAVIFIALIWYCKPWEGYIASSVWAVAIVTALASLLVAVTVSFLSKRQRAKEANPPRPATPA